MFLHTHAQSFQSFCDLFVGQVDIVLTTVVDDGTMSLEPGQAWDVFTNMTAKQVSNRTVPKHNLSEMWKNAGLKDPAELLALTRAPTVVEDGDHHGSSSAAAVVGDGPASVLRAEAPEESEDEDDDDEDQQKQAQSRLGHTFGGHDSVDEVRGRGRSRGAGKCRGRNVGARAAGRPGPRSRSARGVAPGHAAYAAASQPIAFTPPKERPGKD